MHLQDSVAWRCDVFYEGLAPSNKIQEEQKLSKWMLLGSFGSLTLFFVEEGAAGCVGWLCHHRQRWGHWSWIYLNDCQKSRPPKVQDPSKPIPNWLFFFCSGNLTSPWLLLAIWIFGTYQRIGLYIDTACAACFKSFFSNKRWNNLGCWDFFIKPQGSGFQGVYILGRNDPKFARFQPGFFLASFIAPPETCEWNPVVLNRRDVVLEHDLALRSSDTTLRAFSISLRWTLGQHQTETRGACSCNEGGWSSTLGDDW